MYSTVGHRDQKIAEEERKNKPDHIPDVQPRLENITEKRRFPQSKRPIAHFSSVGNYSTFLLL